MTVVRLVQLVLVFVFIFALSWLYLDFGKTEALLEVLKLSVAAAGGYAMRALATQIE